MIQRLAVNTGELPVRSLRLQGLLQAFGHDIFCEVVSAGAESLYPPQEKCSYVHRARDNGARLHPAGDARAMRVLIVSAAYPPMRAGEATNTFHLATRLADRGHQVTVLTSIVEHVARGVGVEVRAVMPHWGWSALPRFAATLRHTAPDAILLMYIGWIYDSHPMVTFAPTVARKLLPSVPFVTRFENMSAALPGGTPLFARVARHAAARCAGTRNVDYNYGTLLRDSRALIVLSDHHRAALAGHNAGVEEKTTLIPPPPNMPIVRDDGEVRELTREALGVSRGVPARLSRLRVRGKGNRYAAPRGPQARQARRQRTIGHHWGPPTAERSRRFGLLRRHATPGSPSRHRRSRDLDGRVCPRRPDAIALSARRGCLRAAVRHRYPAQQQLLFVRCRP